MTDTEVRFDGLEPWEQLREFVRAGNPSGVNAVLTRLEPAENIRALFRLSHDEQERLMELLAPVRAAELFEDLPDSHAAELIERLEADHAATIVEALASDRRADVLGNLEAADAAAILGEMNPAIAESVRGLIAYPADTAGGLMVDEHFAWPGEATLADFVGELRHRRERFGELPQRVLVLDASKRPIGGVEIADLLVAPPTTRLADLSQPIVPLPVTATLDELESYFDRYETLGAPIVGADGRLVGRIRRRAVAEAIAEKASTDRLKEQGIVGGEELRAMPVLRRSRRRLSWLSVNIVLNLIAASVIAFFQDTLSAVIALAVFLPIVSDMSGCSGNQAVAVSMRELTLGIIRPRDALRVWWQEASVGVLNGIVLGILLSLAALLWQGSPALGLVVGLALALNTVVAVSIGGTVPLVLKAWGADPAIASGPVLTTVTDMCGFFLVLGFATLALPWLT